MKTALDTNIVSGLITETSRTAEIVGHLNHCRNEDSLVISAPVYSELLAHPRVTLPFLNRLLNVTGIVVDFDMSQNLWTMAGLRFSRYSLRRQKATREIPKRLLADFVIGAHALTAADHLMPYDTKGYRKDFPELRLYPEPSE